MKTDALHLASFCTSHSTRTSAISVTIVVVDERPHVILSFYLWRKEIVVEESSEDTQHKRQQHHHIHVIKMNENCLSKHLKNINCFHIPINFISLRDQLLKNPKFNRGKTINTRKICPTTTTISSKTKRS
jgi:hypothetical protein